MSARRFHCAVSVDIDRFSDRVLETKWLPMFAQAGATSASDIRRLCAEARAAGREVFPPCDEHDERGICRGHENTTDTETNDHA